MNTIILYYAELRDASIGYAFLVNHDRREFFYYKRVPDETFFKATPTYAFFLEQRSVQSVRNLYHYLLLRNYLETDNDYSVYE